MAKKEQSIEECMEELDAVLEILSQGDIGMDESIKQYARAADLIEKCNGKLKDAQLRIEEIDKRMVDTEAIDGL